MSQSFSTSALEGQVFFLEGRYKPEHKKLIADVIHENGGTLAKKFGPDVTVVLNDNPGKSNHPQELIRNLRNLTDLLGLRECDPAAVFADDDARRRLDRLPWFAFAYGFVFKVCDAAWRGQTFQGIENVYSDVPWRFVNTSFTNCQLEHLHVVGTMSGPDSRTALQGGGMTNCALRNCSFAYIEQWSANGVTFDDCRARRLSRCEIDDVRWIRGMPPDFSDSTARTLVIKECPFPGFRKSKFNDCRFEQLGHDPAFGRLDDNLLLAGISDCSLENCSLIEVRLDQLKCKGTSFSSVTFQNCEFKELIFTGCDLSGCRFENVSVGTLDFNDCKLDGCIWAGPAPRTLGLPVDAFSGIAGLTGVASQIDGSTEINIEEMPGLTAFCKMFVARDNVKFEFLASTADGQGVNVLISKLRSWEFSATGESVGFKEGWGGFDRLKFE